MIRKVNLFVSNETHIIIILCGKKKSSSEYLSTFIEAFGKSPSSAYTNYFEFLPFVLTIE